MLSLALVAAGAQPTKNQLVLGKLRALEGELEKITATKREREKILLEAGEDCDRCMNGCKQLMEEDFGQSEEEAEPECKETCWWAC